MGTQSVCDEQEKERPERCYDSRLSCRCCGADLKSYVAYSPVLIKYPT